MSKGKEIKTDIKVPCNVSMVTSHYDTKGCDDKVCGISEFRSMARVEVESRKY